LDKLLYLGVAQDPESRERILLALTRKFHLLQGTNLQNVAQVCPNNLTGTKHPSQSS
jgi:peroxin-6